MLPARNYRRRRQYMPTFKAHNYCPQSSVQKNYHIDDNDDNDDEIMMFIIIFIKKKHVRLDFC